MRTNAWKYRYVQSKHTVRETRLAPIGEPNIIYLIFPIDSDGDLDSSVLNLSSNKIIVTL